MNKFTNLILALVAMFVLATSSKAASTTLAVTGASTNQIILGALHIQNIQVNNDSASALIVKFFDAKNTNLTFVVGAYTNNLYYATNIVETTVNIFGVTTYVTNSAVYTYANPVGQATNAYRILTQVNVAASSSVTITPVGLYTSFGLLSTNNQAANYVVTYSSIQ